MGGWASFVGPATHNKLICNGLQPQETAMDDASLPRHSDSDGDPVPVQSLRELLDRITGRAFSQQEPQEDSGLAEPLPFPFLALVGQMEMKLALLAAVINPLVNGVLLVGPRGTGKTTIVRSLVDLLPLVNRSACHYGCLPEDIEAGGIDAVCPDCAKKFAQGISLTRVDRGRLMELPISARLEDVIGEWETSPAPQHNSMRLKSGLLKQADLNVLYLDEVNLLNDELINAILDAAAQGTYTVRHGPLASTYRSRFTLIGSMNPEEGNLRPQIMDRFGLRVVVRGLESSEQRLEAYRRSRAYRLNPRATVAQFAEETMLAREEIQSARDLLPQVVIPGEVEQTGTQLVQQLGIASIRAEIAMFEAARALAAADGRKIVHLKDIRRVAPLALRYRQSSFMIKYFHEQGEEEKHLNDTLNTILGAINHPPEEGEDGFSEQAHPGQ
jgi:magnesium chelatase subunit I